MSRRKKQSIEDTLRAELSRRLEAGSTVAGIARAAGMDVAGLWRFLHRERTLNLANVNRLADTFRLRLIGPRQRKRTVD